jgi:hypothetical protein
MYLINLLQQKWSSILHTIAHILRWNYVTIHVWYYKDVMYVGCKCIGCGKWCDVDEEESEKKYVS